MCNNLNIFVQKKDEKKREVKRKREREQYTQLNAEVQRIVRRDKKAFLREQCKEIETTNRLEKIKSLFKETFHAKMGTIKDGNDKDLIKREEIKKGWQEYIEKLY